MKTILTIRRDNKISLVDGKELVGLFVIDEDCEVLLDECSVERADLVLKTWSLDDRWRNWGKGDEEISGEIETFVKSISFLWKEEPLDGDEVDKIVELIRRYLDYANGNIP